MPDKNSGQPIARPKRPIVGRPIPRAKHILPTAETGNATIEQIMKIRRRSSAYISAESLGLNTQQNYIRKELEKQRYNLRSARNFLKEIRDNAPLIDIPIPDLNDLKDLFSTSKKKSKKLPNKIPRSRGLKVTEALLDATYKIKNHQIKLTLHAEQVANQKQIVLELEKQVEALEKQDHEIETQKEDNTWEKKILPPEN